MWVETYLLFSICEIWKESFFQGQNLVYFFVINIISFFGLNRILDLKVL
jgi:hypothetical protein